MQKQTTPPAAGLQSNPLEDEDILDFAEEVLASNTEDLADFDEAALVSDDDEDIIDLTDVADTPLDEDDDILELTEEVGPSAELSQDSTEPLDRRKRKGAAEEEIIDIADEEEIEEVDPEELLQDDEIVELEDEADENILLDEDLLGEDLAAEDLAGIDDTATGIRQVGSASAPEFTIENDTIELSEADRKALEEEFSFEPPEELLGDIEDEPPQTAEGGIEPFEADFDATVEVADPTGKDAIDEVEIALADSDEEKPSTPVEKLELTDDDRRILEDELQLESTEGSAEVKVTSVLEPFERTAETPGSDQVGQPLSEADLALETVFGENAETEPPEEESAEAVDSLEPTSAGVSHESVDLGDLFGEEPVTDAVTSSDEEFMERPAIPAESSSEEAVDLGELFSDSDGIEPLTTSAEGHPPGDAENAETSAETEPAEIQFAFSDDNGPEHSESEPVAPPVEVQNAESELALEFDESQALKSEVREEAPLNVDEPEPLDFGDSDDHGVAGRVLIVENQDDHGEEFRLPTEEEQGGEEAISVAALFTAGAATGTAAGEIAAERARRIAEEEDEPLPGTGQLTDDRDLNMEFEHPEPSEQQDLHRMADPISIRVKEPSVKDSANEDELLNRVFDAGLELPPREDLEEMVENTVRRLFAEKVEVILTQAIERALTREIERIKSLLTGDLDQNA